MYNEQTQPETGESLPEDERGDDGTYGSTPARVTWGLQCGLYIVIAPFSVDRRSIRSPARCVW